MTFDPGYSPRARLPLLKEGALYHFIFNVCERPTYAYSPNNKNNIEVLGQFEVESIEEVFFSILAKTGEWAPRWYPVNTIHNIKEIQVSDLPLYIWMPLKTNLFAQYLNGTPIIKQHYT